MKNFLPKDNTGLDLPRHDGFDLTGRVREPGQSGGTSVLQRLRRIKPALPGLGDLHAATGHSAAQGSGAAAQASLQDNPLTANTPSGIGNPSSPSGSDQTRRTGSGFHRQSTWTRLRNGELRPAFALVFTMVFVLLPCIVLLSLYMGGWFHHALYTFLSDDSMFLLLDSHFFSVLDFTVLFVLAVVVTLGLGGLARSFTRHGHGTGFVLHAVNLAVWLLFFRFAWTFFKDYPLDTSLSVPPAQEEVWRFTPDERFKN